MKGKDILLALIKDISAQRFAATGRLPSEQALCASFGASRMTVRGALAELQRRGLIEKRNGAGSFLTARAWRKSGLVGLVIPDYASFGFFADVKQEIERHCALLGYRTRLVMTRETERETAIRDIRRQVRELAAARTEGVVFRPYVGEEFAEANAEIVRILQRTETPVVLIDSDIARPPERSNLDLIAVNNIDAGRRIADYLHTRGYGRIAFLSPGNERNLNANWSNRLFGLAGELALLGCGDGVRTLRFAPDDADALARALRGPRRPAAIVCGNDECAAALMATLRRLGIRIPEAVAVVGFDDIPLSRATEPPLTTVSQPVRKIASTAFKALLARIRYPNNATREIYLNAPLVARGSA